MQGLLVENCRIFPVAVPVNTTGAAVAGFWISLRHFRKVAFLISQGAWAAGTPAVTLNQATSNAGAGSKALAFSTYYAGSAIAQTTGLDILTPTAVVSNTFNLPNTANTFNIIEVQSRDMDFMNKFNWLQLAIASPGANADLICCWAVCYDADYAGRPASLPTCLA